MGQSISSMIKSVDGGDQSAQDTKDTLNALYALGASRMDAAYSQAMVDSDSKYAPISKLILRRQQVVCKASTDLSGITQGIKDSIGDLMSGQILDGVVDLIADGLNVVLGESAGQITSSYTYGLVATDLGGLLRLDVDIYNFALESQGLQTKIQNMTAVSALVSSIDSTKLTAADLRAIVSVTYGSSTVQVQQQILDLVMAAWTNDNKVANTGEKLTDTDLAGYRSKIVPSKYAGKLASGARPHHHLTKKPKKIDKAALMLATNQAKARNPEVKEAITAPVTLWVQLQNPADEIFLGWLQGIMTATAVKDVFEFTKIDDGVSGNAIGLKCEVFFYDGPHFDKALSYIEDTVFGKYLNSSGDFTKYWIGKLALQYTHPVTGGEQSGLCAHITFNNNVITNNSSDTIRFVEAESGTTLLELAPKAFQPLTGVIEYIAGPVQDGVPETTPPLQWLTYKEDLEGKLLNTMPVSVLSGTDGGYILSFTAPDNSTITLAYDAAWPS
jgi:hypothetical protein